MRLALPWLAAAVMAVAPAYGKRTCFSPDSAAYQAASLDELYDRGHLVEAAWRGWAEGTIDGRLDAARSVLALAVVAPDFIDQNAALDLAEADLKAVLDTRPNDVFAELQYVALLGLKGRTMSPLRAHLSGIGSRARKRLNALLEADPTNPYALNFSGLWHLELVSRGGRKLAGLFYDADEEAGREQVELAVAMKPNDLPILYESGRALLDFREKGDDWADFARLGRLYLQRAVNAPTTNAVEAALSALADETVNGAPYDPRDHLCPPYWFNPDRLERR